MAFDVGRLTGRIDLEDNFSSPMDLIAYKLDKIEQKLGSTGQRVAETAAGFLTAQAAAELFAKGLELATGFLADMTIHGAAVADVAENFEHLTSQVGVLGETLLGELRAGTHATIDDLELMKLVNADLAAGMELSNEQFRTLADGAFALAQATGEDVAGALDKMNDAMLTGRTRSVQMLTGKIDLVAAEEKFALSIGTTRDLLTEEGKLQAAREAILGAVGAATQRLGEQTDGLDEIVAQAMTSWQNFQSELGMSIATSPRVISAFVAIRDSLVDAFGGDSQDMIQTITGWVEGLADMVAHYAPIVISAFQQTKEWIVGAWAAASEAAGRYGPIVVYAFKEVRDFILDMYTAIRATWDALPSWMKEVAKTAVGAAIGVRILSAGVSAASDVFGGFIGKAGDSITALAEFPRAMANVNKFFGTTRDLMMIMDFSSLVNAGASIKLIGSTALAAIGPLGQAALVAGLFMAAWKIGQMEVVSDFFQKLGLRVMGYSSAQADAMIATDKATRAALEQSEAVEEQAKFADELKKQTDEVAAAMRQVTTDLNAQADAGERSNLVMAQTTEEAKKQAAAMAELSSAGKDYKATIAEIDAEIVKAVKGYLAAGVSQGTLATAYKLTQTQVSAIAKAYGVETEAQKKATEASKEKAEALRELNALAQPWSRTLQGLGARIINQATAYLELGASASTVAKALGLTEAHMVALQKRMEETEKSTNSLSESVRDGLGGALDEAAIKVRTLSGELITLEEHKARQTAGGTFEINRGNLSENAKYWGVPEGLAVQMAKEGFSFQEIIAAWQSGTWKDWVPSGPRIPGFREGGIGNFGDGTLAMLHGPEAIIPLDRAGDFGSNYTFYVNGTAVDVANQIADVLMQRAKLGRQFGSA